MGPSALEQAELSECQADPADRSGAPLALPAAECDLENVVFRGADGSRRAVGRLLDDTFTDGFIVLHRGRILTERYCNGMTPHTPHLLQSVSKSVVGTVAGILIGEGLLDPGKPVTRYVPELKNTAWNGALLRHVLDMTSGVRFVEEYTDPDSDVGRTNVACGWKPAPADSEGWPGAVWEQILSLKERDAAHGERFAYRSIETDVLAHAMQRVSDTPLPCLVSDLFWSRIGTEEDGYFTVDPTGFGLADGGFNATLRDMARFEQVHLDGGVSDGRQVLPASWVQYIRSGDHGLIDEDGRSHFPNGCYRIQFWVENRDRQTVLCLGVFGQMVYIAPAHNLVVVKFSSWPNFTEDEMHSETLLAIHAIAEEVG